MSSAANFVSVAMSIPASQKTSRNPSSRAKPEGRDLARLPSSVNSFSISPGLDELGIRVRGVFAGTSDAALDGPVDSQSAINMPLLNAKGAIVEGPQVSEKFEAGKDAAFKSSSDLNAEQAGVDETSENQAGSQRQHAKIVDVSEGTALDPLSDKTYDLNFAKTVPSLKELSVLP